MIVVFIVIVGGFLTYKYRGKPTPSELAIKNREKQEYIISKLQQLSDVRSKTNHDMITGLPLWNTQAEMG